MVKDIDLKKAKLRKLSLGDVSVLCQGVLDCAFHKNEAGTTYIPENVELSKAYFELLVTFPDLEMEKIGLAEFFELYSDGQYDNYLTIAREDGRIKYFERTVDSAIETAIRYHTGGRLAASAAALIDNINKVVEKYSGSLENIGAADIQNFLKDFGKLSSELNPQTVTDAVIKMHQSETNKTEQPKRTRKRESTKTTNK